MRLKLMPIFLEALTLAILGTPVQAKAAASSHLNNSTSDFAQRLNPTSGQRSIISALHLSPDQEAQQQQIKQSPTFNHKRRLTQGQRHRRLMRRRARSGGR